MSKTGTRNKNKRGSVRQLPSGRFEYRYTGPNGRVSGTADTEELAWATIDDANVQIRKGTYVEPTAVTLGDWIKDWMKTYKKRTLKPKSYYDYTNMYIRYIKDSLGLKRLDKLKGNDIQAWINDLHDKKLAPATIRLAYAVVRGALDKAYRLDIISTMPTKAVELPKIIKAEKEILSTKSYNLLIKNAHKYPMGDTVLLLLGTGMRPGEAFGLMWKDVDLKRGVITVCGNRQYLGNVGDDMEITGYQVLQQESAKTDSGNREIPIMGITQKLLDRLSANRTHITHVCVDDRGQTLYAQSFARALAYMLDELKIPQVTPHALRHTFATQAVDKGFDYKTLQDILGHSTLAMTMETYVQVDMDRKKKEMRKLV